MASTVYHRVFKNFAKSFGSNKSSNLVLFSPRGARFTASYAQSPADKLRQTVLFSITERVGGLEEVLSIFRKNNVNLTKIESRPSQTNTTEYDFFVDLHPTSPPLLERLMQDLTPITTRAKMLDSASTTSTPWFPRKFSDMERLSTNCLDGGSDLEADHPGFHDATYRKRRQLIADIAFNYKHGTPIPRVEYTREEVQTWGLIFRELTKLYPTHACSEFNKVFPLLIDNCGYREDNIPQLEDVSNFLKDCTGFRLRPTAGLLSSRDFLNGLAFRVFHSTQYIRHNSKPLYTPEPDIVHELLGHAPLFADPEFAQFSQEIGLASLGASDEDILKLATCYWFTVEFGMCRQKGEMKAYGAGLLSSFGELQYCLSGKPQIKPFEPAVTALQKYPITEYQPVYFATESFEESKQKMREFALTLSRPFGVRYNPYTESIEVLDNHNQIRKMAHSVKSDLDLMIDAMDRIERRAIN